MGIFDSSLLYHLDGANMHDGLIMYSNHGDLMEWKGKISVGGVVEVPALKSEFLFFDLQLMDFYKHKCRNESRSLDWSTVFPLVWVRIVVSIVREHTIDRIN